MEDLDDYRWLIGDDAAERLAGLRAAGPPTTALVARLRRELSASRVRLLLEQVDLRRRAAVKFAAAERMFFTPTTLEQATDETVARYKAGRFPTSEPCADLCCGIGGDLFALAERGTTVGVERQPAVALLAEANAAALGLAGTAKVEVRDVADYDLGDYAAWHIDPDRRPAGRRTTRVVDHQPGADVLARLLKRCPDAGIKLAPAAELPESWEQSAELEWISRGGECRQLVAWFGRLAATAGQRRATVLLRDGGARGIVGRPGPLAAFSPPRRYLFEPDAAVLAAGLTAALAGQHQLSGIAPRIGYLTGDVPLEVAALACFEVTDVLPLHVKRLKALLVQRGIGRVEVKKRGVDCDPAELQKQLAGKGDLEATLLIAPLGRTVTAILARRCPRT